MSAIQATARPTRWFYRCSDCLAVGAIDTHEKSPSEYACSCGGRMESMGYVHRFRVVNTDYRCPCDSRCTNATGPSCDCSCGGENHGTGRIVEVLRDVGPIPVLRAGNEARAAEYRFALEAARTRIEALHSHTIDAKARGEFVNGDAYWSWQGDYRALVHAKGLRTHKGRLAALANVAQERA